MQRMERTADRMHQWIAQKEVKIEIVTGAGFGKGNGRQKVSV